MGCTPKVEAHLGRKRLVCIWLMPLKHVQNVNWCQVMNCQDWPFLGIIKFDEQIPLTKTYPKKHQSNLHCRLERGLDWLNCYKIFCSGRDNGLFRPAARISVFDIELPTNLNTPPWTKPPATNSHPKKETKRVLQHSCFFFKVINDVRFQMRGTSIIFHSLTSYIFLVQNSIVEMDRFSSPKILRVLNLESRWILSRLDPTITVRPFPRWFLENDFPSRAPNLGNVITVDLPRESMHFQGLFCSC